MDNDDTIIGTIWSRRQAMKRGLGALIGGGIVVNFLGCAGSSQPIAATVIHTPLLVTPALTEGPFFVDEKLNRSNLLAGTTRSAVINGAPLDLNLTILRLDNAGNAAPLTGAQVDVWHSDTAGIYSDENNPMNAEVTSGQRWLRGYQLVDTSGNVQFSTIVPGWYNGRTPHIHFKVRQFSPSKQQTAEFTSQFFFADEALDRIYAKPPYNARGRRNMLNTDDGIYSQPIKDGSAAGSHQLLALVPTTSQGYKTQFTIIVSDASLHDRSERGPGGPGFGPGGGRGGGPDGGPDGGPGFGPPPGGPGGGRPGPPPDDGGFGPPPM
jgi:protocatechuate 3,4-dioxygenase beta subunit